MELESAVRLEAFKWLSEQKLIYPDSIPWDILQKGFIYHGNRVPLVSVQGIFKPKILRIPLSIRTSFNSPYDDIRDQRSPFLTYRYRGTDINQVDNVGLRQAMKMRLPLIYFQAIKTGKYVATWPVFVIQDNPSELNFKIVVDTVASLKEATSVVAEKTAIADGRRAYITTEAKIRLHQQIFRERVLNAYKYQCTFCRLKHEELLEASHIIPDSEPEGIPVVENGLSLCKLHHTAFDKYFIGVNPDYKIQVRHDLLEEKDGPMLQYGIKELHGKTLILPKEEKHFPKKEYLEWRFERFQKA